jgi:SAM-dependent methyltransferase
MKKELLKVMKKEKYGKKYFESINYVNYLDRKNKYIKHAEDIKQLLESVSLLNPNSKILDYGCAVGFLLEGFKKQGYNNIHGFDISEWALEQCKNKNLNVFENFQHESFDLITALDVFEHMTDKEIKSALNYFNTDTLLVRIPCSVDGEDYHLDISKLDPTHCNCKTKNGWKKLFKSLGYDLFLNINISTIYDTPGVLCWLCVKTPIENE